MTPKIGMVFTLAEGGIDKPPKNVRILDNISSTLSLYDSFPWQLVSIDSTS